jgi:hypothetical protein
MCEWPNFSRLIAVYQSRMNSASSAGVMGHLLDNSEAPSNCYPLRNNVVNNRFCPL